MTSDGQRFSDEEFAQIIRAAQELQERAAAAPGGDAGRTALSLPAGGMSLAEIEAVAGEVGLDPAYIKQAAAIMRADRPVLSANPILGGPANFAYRTTVPGRVDPSEYPRLADAIRHELGQHGDRIGIQDSLEWKLVGQATELAVSVLPSRDETLVSVVADRGSTAMLCYVFSIVPWLIVGVGIGNGLDANLAGGLSIMAGAAAGGYATGRTIWTVATRKFMRKMRRLTTALTRDVTELARTEPELPLIDASRKTLPDLP